MLRETLYLAKHGVPWSEIHQMSRARRAACCVALGELEGGRFDWSALSWLT